MKAYRRSLRKNSRMRRRLGAAVLFDCYVHSGDEEEGRDQIPDRMPALAIHQSGLRDARGDVAWKVVRVVWDVVWKVAWEVARVVWDVVWKVAWKVAWEVACVVRDVACVVRVDVQWVLV